MTFHIILTGIICLHLPTDEKETLFPDDPLIRFQKNLMKSFFFIEVLWEQIWNKCFVLSRDNTFHFPTVAVELISYVELPVNFKKSPLKKTPKQVELCVYASIFRKASAINFPKLDQFVEFLIESVHNRLKAEYRQ